MTARDISRLQGVHPTLVSRVTSILRDMELGNAPMFVVEGVRSVARQAALYAQGRTTPGPIVTHADGIKNRSRHQVHEDNFGYAVDCAFVDPVNPFAETHPWESYGEAAEARFLVWGGRWTSIMDKPHVELPIVSEGKKA